jgi:hypothetical protein
MRWVQRYAPEFEKRWTRFARKVGRSWRVDETYLKVRGRWAYLYRAVDRDGDTVDFRLSPTRDVAAAKAFFRKALRTHKCAPFSITLDGYAASHRAVREMPREEEAWKNTKLRSSKYLNNLIEQDHRGIAQLPPLPGSNCSTVFAKDNSPWRVFVSRTKLSLQSGMRYSPRSLYSSTGLVAPLAHICTKALPATL